MPVSSLPSPYGIGTFGKAAVEFVDFVAECGHAYWQVLPLGQTSYGDSPYQSFSAFAGNPYFIDLDILADEGLLTKEYIESFDWGGDINQVDYEKLFNSRYKVLKTAYKKFVKHLSESGSNVVSGTAKPAEGSRGSADGAAKSAGNGRNSETAAFDSFKKDNKDWLDEYAMYMACKEHFGYKAWSEWDKDIRFREEKAVAAYKEKLADEIDFWIFCQYEFFKQWNSLKNYANSKGIDIIGDIPIYVALDSADVWAHPEVFMLNENLIPDKVAGVPPDAFTDLGQKWGNPLYDWKALEADDFGWWRRRMRAQAQMYDVIRIDHFLGIIRYYTIPARNPDAKQGEYKEGPGKKLCDAINESIGNKKIIAEDLGVEMPEVTGLLQSNGYPGMKVLEFAFDGNRKNPHLPHNYTNSLVVYGGTHDNETLYGYYTEHSPAELKYAYAYLNTASPRKMVEESFRMAYASVADTVIFQVQDILCLGNTARINTPSTLGNNWKWRMKKGELDSGHAARMRHLASVYGRTEND